MEKISKAIRKIMHFGGVIISALLAVAEIVTLLGMPWMPDLTNPMHRWVVAFVLVATSVLCFLAGWLQRGLDDDREYELDAAKLELNVANLELGLVKERDATIAELRERYDRDVRIARGKGEDRISELQEEVDKLRGIVATLRADNAWYEGKYGRRDYS